MLQSLAAAAGFALDIAETDESLIDERKLTARIEGAPIFDVLAVVLRGLDYDLEIDFDPLSQAHRIALLRIGAPELLESEFGDTLYELLEGPDPNVVVAVIDALERAGDPGVIPELEPLLEDEDPDVQEAAARAIEALRERL